eukprot:CAMPEP_0194203566 /NCGR_PEP_ID=MMETSP0156-20130528/3297_1 /TAXON_ID=33649 /ORGANISM="Thalassionema nitzschioides, Strain L26-B" /LENGTH=638 /DNA_ID=CAMNT_0038929339 /DNA_START=510 /DNA_END=2426 /DNA_ORIENTATION=+
MKIILTSFLLAISSVTSQTPNSCIPDRHFNDDDGYFEEGVAGLSTDLDLDSAHGQKLPNSTWAAGLDYPMGQFEQCDAEDRFCRAPCNAAPGCQQFFSTHTCAILTFCNAEGDNQPQNIWQLPSQDALDNCDFDDAILVGSTSASSIERNRMLTHQAKQRELQGDQLCFGYPFEVDHELSTYFFASQENCEQNQKIAVVVADYDQTADQCYAIGETTSRLNNCDCRLEEKPSTLGEPCRSEFSDRCFEIMQPNRPDDGCCERGDCISTLKDFEHPDGRAKELERRETCDDSTPGLCYNEDGLGTDTNRLGSTNCCTKTCTECGTELGAHALWKPCTALNGTVGNCGFLSRYDSAPFQCDFSLCDDGDEWNVDGCPFKLFAGEASCEDSGDGGDNGGDGDGGDGDGGDNEGGDGDGGDGGDNGGFTLCFPGHSIVNLEDGTSIEMSELKIGDRVQVTKDGKFDIVYSFGHYQPESVSEYLNIESTAKAAPITMSPPHMLFLDSGKVVPASTIKIGDVLLGGNVVIKVNKVSSKGAYAPFTYSGSIVVNGVVASNYVSLTGTSTFLGVDMQSLAHTVVGVRRAFCKLNLCEETYSDDGIATWVPYQTAAWIAAKEAVIGFLIVTGGVIAFSRRRFQKIAI